VLNFSSGPPREIQILERKKNCLLEDEGRSWKCDQLCEPGSLSQILGSLKIRILERNVGLLVDEYIEEFIRTSFAAGDAAESFDTLLAKKGKFGLWTTANRTKGELRDVIWQGGEVSIVE